MTEVDELIDAIADLIQALREQIQVDLDRNEEGKKQLEQMSQYFSEQEMLGSSFEEAAGSLLGKAFQAEGVIHKMKQDDTPLSEPSKEEDKD